MKRASRNSIVIRVDSQDKEAIENLAKYFGERPAAYAKRAVIHYSNIVLESLQKETSVNFLLNMLSINQAKMLVEKLPKMIEETELKLKEQQGGSDEQGTEDTKS